MNPLDNFSKIGQRVEHAHEFIRIDAYLAKFFPFLSRVKWKQKILNGDIRVESYYKNQVSSVKATYQMQKYDQIWYTHFSEKQSFVYQHIDVIYDDGDVCIFSKPPDMVVHPVGVYGKNNFITHIHKMGYTDCFPVHRIDRETSGLLVCARKSLTRKKISELFVENKIQKVYLALTKGDDNIADKFTISSPIGTAINSKIRLKHWVNVPNALPSVTSFQKLASLDGYHLLACMPKTGRTNQIRIHLASIGQWIVGDKMYHPNEDVFLEFYNNGYTDYLNKNIIFPRHILHNSGIFIPGILPYPVICKIPHDLKSYSLMEKLMEQSNLTEDLNYFKHYMDGDNINIV